MRTSGKWGKFWLLKLNSTLKVKIDCPQNNRDHLNQGVLHLWSKFGDPSLNVFRVIARTSKWLTHKHTHGHTDTPTDADNGNTRGPKLASGKNSDTRAFNSPGARFNIKMTSYQYRKSHCGDKTILPPSYLHNGISYTGKMASLYWIRARIYSTHLNP